MLNFKERLTKVKMKYFSHSKFMYLWIMIRNPYDEEFWNYSRGTRESWSDVCWTQLPGSPGV